MSKNLLCHGPVGDWQVVLPGARVNRMRLYEPAGYQSAGFSSHCLSPAPMVHALLDWVGFYFWLFVVLGIEPKASCSRQTFYFWARFAAPPRAFKHGSKNECSKRVKAPRPQSLVRNISSAVFHSTVVITGLLLTPHNNAIQSRSLRPAALPQNFPSLAVALLYTYPAGRWRKPLGVNHLRPEEACVCQSSSRSSMEGGAPESHWPSCASQGRVKDTWESC